MNMAFGQVVTLALVLSLPDFSGVHCTLYFIIVLPPDNNLTQRTNKEMVGRNEKRIKG